jgi:tRNA(Leu) C34 or U34 (ribose-2'-O)-methylase TrmL
MNRTPAVVLIDPKYPHNVGNAFRACAALGASQLFVTGHRARWETTGKGQRLPREERMKQYNGKVELIRAERPFENLDTGVVPIAVEISPTAEPLALFRHPDNACYVFGPEDGGIPKSIRRLCHRFVILPTDHCINLAAAVNCVLMDRRVKRQLAGLEPILPSYDTIQEDREYLFD